MDRLAVKYLRPRKTPSTACSGCGLGQVHKKILLAIEQLGLGINDIVWGTGIGCSGRQTFNTWKGDNFAGTHGRVYALATGLRLALPEDKKIILTVGDGDAFGIGLSHLLHCARRNAGITVIVADNFGYQSTGGQYGYTTPQSRVTDSSPYGLTDPNWLQNGLDILNLLRDAGAGFLARHLSFEGQNAVESIKRAIGNKGFSLVHIIYPCVTHFGEISLKTGDREAIFRWFENLFDGRSGDPGTPAFKSGIFHDAVGARPEFSAALKAWTSSLRQKENPRA
ncbi:MAG: 2-oxoglutarate ferredoxin oxidoreductase subunit beta [Deltaproteobacteria bacterium]|jgi:2-oxoglutarate ferredoxin oxidoreductase subunit beta|nr:2-oxoglutarate ferredoxin oxidoreductase subunit beta [Deltaproteobacteria bacterium]